MFCKNCGANIPDNVRFCGKCGCQVGKAVEKKVAKDEFNIKNFLLSLLKQLTDGLSNIIKFFSAKKLPLFPALIAIVVIIAGFFGVKALMGGKALTGGKAVEKFYYYFDDKDVTKMHLTLKQSKEIKEVYVVDYFEEYNYFFYPRFKKIVISDEKKTEYDESYGNFSSIFHFEHTEDEKKFDEVSEVILDMSIRFKNASFLFKGFKNLKKINSENIDLSFAKSSVCMFSGCGSLQTIDTSKWNTKNITDMRGMFNWCESLRELDVSKWNTENVTNMQSMFSDCTSLQKLDVSKWNTGNVTNMGSMFSMRDSFFNDKLLILDVDKWDTRNVKNMESMFCNCNSLQKLDVSKWDTSSVTDMQGVFANCASLQKIDVSKWNTGNVTNMNHMFYNCSSLQILSVSKWDTSNVIDMGSMFFNCNSLKILNISKWDMNNVKYMEGMFYKKCLSPSEVDVNKVIANPMIKTLFQKYQEISLDIRSKIMKNINRYGLRVTAYVAECNYKHECKMDKDGTLYECESDSYVIDGYGRTHNTNHIRIHYLDGTVFSFFYVTEMAGMSVSYERFDIAGFYDTGHYDSFTEEEQKVMYEEAEKYREMKDYYQELFALYNSNTINGIINKNTTLKGELQTEGKNKYYIYEDGNYAINAWVEIKGNWYYFDGDGIMVTNVLVDNYYVGSDGLIVKNKWVEYEGDNYYLDKEGMLLTNQWVDDYYVGKNGKRLRNTWIDNKYYIGADGKKLKNTITPDGYYVGKNGEYKIDTNNKEGWVDNHYYIKNRMQKNQWLVLGNNDKYYLDQNGDVVKNKWIEDTYYLGEDGKMLRNASTPDGYFVNYEGKYVNNKDDIDYDKVKGEEWYETKDGLWYYFLQDRITKKYGWHKDKEDKQWYYLDPNTGIMVTGWKEIDGNYYYFNENHSMNPNWYHDALDDKWKSHGRNELSYGSMYADTYTPDGYYVDERGVLK